MQLPRVARQACGAPGGSASTGCSPPPPPEAGGWRQAYSLQCIARKHPGGVQARRVLYDCIMIQQPRDGWSSVGGRRVGVRSVEAGCSCRSLRVSLARGPFRVECVASLLLPQAACPWRPAASAYSCMRGGVHARAGERCSAPSVQHCILWVVLWPLGCKRRGLRLADPPGPPAPAPGLSPLGRTSRPNTCPQLSRCHDTVVSNSRLITVHNHRRSAEWSGPSIAAIHLLPLPCFLSQAPR